MPACVLAGMVLGLLPSSAAAQDRWFAPDKAAHFVISFFLTTATYTVARDYMEKDRAIQTAVGVTAGLGIAKEVHDALTGEGTFSGKDLVWDGLGIGLGVLIVSQDDERSGHAPAAVLVLGARSPTLMRALAARPAPLLPIAPLEAPNAVDSDAAVPTIRAGVFRLPGG